MARPPTAPPPPGVPRAPRAGASRPGALRPGEQRSGSSRPGTARPTAPRASPAGTARAATPTERARLRRLIRYGVGFIVVVQVVALLFVISPAARAQFAVIDAAVLGAVNAVNGTVGAVNGSVTSGFQTANQWLSRIQGNTQQLQTLADRHSVEYAGGTYADSLASVTRRPTGMIAGRTITAGGRTDSSLSFAGADPTRRMRSIYPGAVPWSPGKYQDERARSANTALLTLRGGMRALHDFNRSIEDASRLTELGNAAGNANSYLAMDELQVRSQLEVARQIQALRAQQALQTNLYAVTESHRIGTEARQHAQDDQSGCQVLTKVMGGVPGAVLGALACTGGGTPPLP